MRKVVSFIVMVVFIAITSRRVCAHDDTRGLSTKTPALQRKWTEHNIVQASPSLLEQYVHGDHPGIACRAAWERMVRLRAGQLQNTSAANATTISRDFLEVITQRFNVEPPSWWVKAIVPIRVAQPSGQSVDPASVSHPVIHASLFGAVEVYNGRGGSIFVDGQRFEAFRALDAFVMVRSQGNCSVVGVHSGRGIEYPIFCLTANGEAVKWCTMVWAGGGKYDYQGKGFHCAELVNGTDSIVVFGVGDDCVYVESFDIDTGRQLIRFSTGY